jgi:anti-anti-sigma regulatory factor
MMALVPPVRTRQLTADAVSEANALVLKLTGVADLRVQDQLMTFLESTHRVALTLRAPEVRVDVTALEFMNSSCLGEFVRWIESVQDGQASYRIRFVANRQHRWQERSLDALMCLNDQIVTVQ